VFHIAAATSAPDERSFMVRNVEGTENVLRIAQKAGVKNIIVLSSLAAAGPTVDGAPISEEVPCRPVSLYGKSKMRMEELIKDQAESDQRITIIRPPAVYGPREENIYTLFKSASRGIAPIIGDGNRPRVSMVHVRDLIRGILLAADKSKEGVSTYFISSDQIYTWNQVTDVLSSLLGKKLWRPKVDPRLLKNISGVLEAFGSLSGKTPMLNRDKAKELSLEWLCSVEKAKKELGFTPKVDLQRGFYETLSWYRAHFWL
jgi:nucleoside-diphosphate-sugar epimerase